MPPLGLPTWDFPVTILGLQASRRSSLLAARFVMQGIKMERLACVRTECVSAPQL